MQQIYKETAKGFEQGVGMLDQYLPLQQGSHRHASAYGVLFQHLVVYLDDGRTTGLKCPKDLIAVHGRKAEPEAITLAHDDVEAEIELGPQGAAREICWTL